MRIRFAAVFTVPFQIVYAECAEAPGTFLGLSQLRLLLSFFRRFDEEVIFRVVKFPHFWKIQVIFAATLVQKPSVEFFVTAGIRNFFSVKRLIDLLTTVRSLPLLHSSVACKYLIVSTKLSLLISIAVVLQALVHDIYRQGENFHRLMVISGKHCRKPSTSDSVDKVFKAAPPPPTPAAVLSNSFLHSWFLLRIDQPFEILLLCCS